MHPQTKQKITDNDETTASPLQEKTFAAGSSETFAEVGFGVEQKMRQIILALPKDNQNASYTYKLYGKAIKNGSYETLPFATGNINTGDANKVKINAADVDSAVKDLEYESVKAVFEAANDDGKNNILSLAEFQILANKATIAEADTENIVWKSTALHSNYSQETLNRIVDGNLSNTWSADQYPAYVDFDLGAEYDLSRIERLHPEKRLFPDSLTTATMVRITANLRKKPAPMPVRMEERFIRQKERKQAVCVSCFPTILQVPKPC